MSTGIDTRAIDPFRQGVEITDTRHRFEGMTPKFVNGDDLSHEVQVVTYGQGNSFVNRTQSISFIDRTDYLSQLISSGSDLFIESYNDLNGMAEATEGTLEPLTIPYKKASLESPQYMARSIKGALDEAGEENGLGYGTSRITQFIEYKDPKVIRPFLDEGQIHIMNYQGPKLDLTYDPVALFLFDGNISDSGPNNIQLEYSGSLAYPSISYSKFTSISGSVNSKAYFHPPSSETGIKSVETATTSPGFPLRITGSFTVECFVDPILDDSTSYIVAFIDQSIGQSALYGIELNYFSHTKNIRITFQNRFLEFYYTADMFRSDGMNHIAITKQVNSGGSLTFNVFLNGNDLTSQTIPGVTLLDSSQAKLYVGNTGPGLITNGGVASLKILDKALNHEQILNEFSKLVYDHELPTGIPQSLGYLTTERSVIHSYNDTNNELIANQVKTTDPNFISILEQLDINLDEDIRSTFGSKSASAGFDVYGGESARYGTDSFSYRGRFRR